MEEAFSHRLNLPILHRILLINYQKNMLPININFGRIIISIKVTIQPEQFYALLKENKDYPKSSQVNEKSFTNLYFSSRFTFMIQ